MIRLAGVIFFLVGSAFAASPQVVALWPEGVPGLHSDAVAEKVVNNRIVGVHYPSLTVYPPKPEKACGTAVIFCPGGGYVKLTIGENGGEETRFLNENGVTVFILKYRMVEYGQPAPLQDVLRAIRLVRSRAAEFGVKPDRIGLLGQSAGGHLAGCAVTMWDAAEGRTGADLDRVGARPDFAALIYPVITMDKPAVHQGSRDALLGKSPAPDLVAKYSLERNVPRNTPPVFLVATMADQSVPVENSLHFYQALRDAGVPAELHVYARGSHGNSLDPQYGPTALWPQRLAEWMRSNGWLSAGQDPAPNTKTFLLLLSTAVALSAATPRAVFNVRDYGATGDGRTLDTAALNRAVDVCTRAGGGTVYLPPGNYLTGTVELKTHVTLELDAGATILGSENPDDYPATKSVWGDDREMMAPLIYAVDAENVTITGRGTIDGQGGIWWLRLRLNDLKKFPRGPLNEEEKAEAKKFSRGRPHLIRPVRCKDLVLEHVNLRNSAEWNVHPMLCENVRIDGISITAPAINAHNTDGINPESCRNVHILNCRIDTGDDCVTLKSGLNELGRRMGRPDENITIANCVMKRGHGGVTIGSEMSGGVRNIVVTNCVFQETDIGIRIKSQRGRGGVVEGLTVSNIVMIDVPSPFTITTFYTGSDKPDDVHAVDEGTPRYRDMLFSNITARGAKNAGSITGLREMPIENLTFSNVHIDAAEGFTCTNAREVSFYDCVINTAKGPALILKSSTGIDAARLRTSTPHEGVALIQTEAAK